MYYAGLFYQTPIVLIIALCALHAAQAVVSGTASSGLLVCVLRIVSKAAMAGDGADREALRNGTRMYFAIAGEPSCT